MEALLVVVMAILVVPVVVYLSVRMGDLASVEVAADALTIRPRGLNRLWAFKSEVRVPLPEVSGVRTNVARQDVPSGLRVPGTYVPGVIQAGTYRKRGEKSFWLVGRTATVTVIDCRGGQFDRIVLQLDDEAAAELTRAVSSRPS